MRTVAPALAERLYERSGAAEWGVSREVLIAGVARSLERAAVPEEDAARAAAGLHLADLALALACIAGVERAWERLIAEHRPALQRAAAAMDPTGAAHELAEALFGDLYGTAEHAGVRQSLLVHYHGRSSLATWLRAVLARRHVDHIRRVRRLTTIDADDTSAAAAARAVDPVDASDEAADGPRFRWAFGRALEAALRRLDGRDRLRLGCYHAQHLTLAQIGQLTGEHEATVSRQLARVRRQLREDVEGELGREHGLEGAALRDGLRRVSLDAGELDLATLFDDSRKVVSFVRSKDETIRGQRD
jgi:RNA polymerase sigma factor (sigma-70 family)